MLKDFEPSKDGRGPQGAFDDGNWEHYGHYLRLKDIGFKFFIGRGSNQVGKKRGKYNKAK